ncbi:MAG: DsbE family thiol:disulfide interchange protein [Pseudomonadota bacterium]
MVRYLTPLLVIALLIVVFSIGLTRDPSELPSTFIDRSAPEFELPRLKDLNTSVGSEDYRGTTALVNVWATWCVGCREEHPFLMELAASGAVPIYGINWRDRRPDALRWLQQYGDPYVASGFDEDGRVAVDWGVYGAPETFLVSADGIVLHKHLGPLTRAIWEQDFVPLLGDAS